MKNTQYLNFAQYKSNHDSEYKSYEDMNTEKQNQFKNLVISNNNENEKYNRFKEIYNEGYEKLYLDESERKTEMEK